MISPKRCSLAATLVALSWAVGPAATAAQPGAAPVPTIEALQGTLVRWSVPGTTRCAMGGRSWAALQETCYYPIDALHAPGLVRVSRQGVGPARFANISVAVASHAPENIELGDIPQANPSPADLRRNTRDQALIAKIWARHEGPARFTLPLGTPMTPLPEAKGFGSQWVFNGKAEASELHSGVDYAVRSGTPVVALADGTVVVAEDLFFTGNAVFIDHGNGLVGMYFHLSEIKVQAGQDVKKGETLGLVGSTGRVSGPHLHLGIRWHDARIDPQPLLEDPAKIPAFAQ
jgi:murein DD-endopeptidase MepM/ murein hydrolase activator NlpD